MVTYNVENIKIMCTVKLRDKVNIWIGDIIKLSVDAIVNAGI